MLGCYGTFSLVPYTPAQGRKGYAHGTVHKGGKRMSESLEKRIDRLCKLAGKTPDELQRNGEWVLGLAGDVCRDTSLYADETVEDICSESLESDEYRKMTEGLVRLEFFASEMTRQKYQAEISAIMGTAWMLKVIETIKGNIYSFRKYGPQFVSILSLAYMNSFTYTVEEMAEELNMSPQNFYKKKRYATILFAYEFEKFKNSLIASADPTGWHGEQMTLDDYMN